MSITNFILNVDHFFDRAERKLSEDLAWCPLLGSFPGAARLVMGSLQAITAFVLSIIFLVPAIFSENARELLKFTASHIVHGLGNMLGGAIETIPFGGLVFWAVRSWKTLGDSSDFNAPPKNGHESKFMAYDNLINTQFAPNNCVIICI